MANLLWGKVYFKDQFAGFLRQEPGERYTFTYDLSYLNSKNPAIAHSLPLQEAPFISEQYLPAFFDNLVAEGWLEEAQMRLLAKRRCSRFELLLAFGSDCAGAVSIIDPEKTELKINKIDKEDPRNVAVYQNRASLSGIQPKLLLIKDKKIFRPAQYGEISTHIAKLPSLNVNEIVYNEYLTLKACQALLPEDDFVEFELTPIPNICDEALVVKRFDRTNQGEKIHFEEFNQLLNKLSSEKYEGSYEDMANFIFNEKKCIPSDAYRLFKRIITGLVTGNTDMHFKNFAMFEMDGLFKLVPNYDQVAAAIYKPYQYVALSLNKSANRIIGELKPNHIVALAREYRLSNDALMMAINDIDARLEAAKNIVNRDNKGPAFYKNKITQFMEKRWKGTFSSIGQLLSKKR